MAIPTFTASATSSIVDLVGDTPLIRLRQIERDVPGVELYAKAEWKNPGGSVKDRPALRMIQEGHRRRAGSTPGKVILDATSGNTGIAYAMMGAALGYRVTLCVPENVTPERKRILRAYGAELIFTNPLEGSDGAIRTAQQMNDEQPGQVLLRRSVQQRRSTGDRTTTRPGPEIIRQTGGRLTHFVAGLGTSGTFVGVGRRLREFNERHRARVGAARFAAARPRRPQAHGVGDRAGHLRSDARRRRRSRRHRRGVRDDAAARPGRRPAGRHLERREPRRRAEGGARADAIVVVVFCDGGERYLSERFWENPPEGALICGTN